MLDSGSTGGIDGGYLIVFLGLVVLWAAEHFLIQASLFDFTPITLHPMGYQLVRLAINLSAAFLLVMTSNREVLILLLGLDFLVSLVVLAYRQYFHRAFSLFFAVQNFREGLKVSSFAIQIIPSKVWLGMVSCLLAKILLATKVCSYPVEATIRPGLVTAGGPVLLITALVMGLQKTSFRFASIRGTPITRAVYVYGYVISWFAEFIIAPDTQEVAEEVARLQEVSPDRLREIEPGWPVDRNVVVVQLESFGWNVLNFGLNGKAVTPYLNKLAGSSRVFKIQVYHDIGSADMDYAVLSGGLPSKRLVSYFVPGLDYARALPRFMSRQGYRTMSLHGATGDFYNRRANFERMGWDEIHFREEFKGLGVEQSYWGVRDAEIFRLSSKKLRAATEREFHFIITLDTHGPFNLIREDEKDIFPQSRVWQENYFNSMSALDKNLQEYVTSLPEGTLVIFYGDHTAGVDYQGFAPAREGTAEYVPCLVHVTPAPGVVSFSPELNHELPPDLRIHDIVNFMRHQVQKNKKVVPVLQTSRG